MRTKPCSATITQGRLDEVADACVTLCVHAGTTMSDAMCCGSR